MYGFLLAMPLAGNWLARREILRPQRVRQTYLAWAFVLTTLTLLFSLQAASAILTRYFYRRAPAFDIDWQNINWTQLADSPARSAGFVVTPTWVQASRIGLALGPSIPLEILGDAHHFQFMNQDVLKQRKAGYFAAACKFGNESITESSVIEKLHGRYRPTGNPQWIIQYRQGFPSFEIILVPVERTDGGISQ